ncbi:cyanophycin metabolism-associated DUF1854 family protein [Variovorax saccharolyticus]|uniref:cyanophycin metabolism-associated DUF1854 family protein n=1 Tax=Variovorax saccharolyticus TaxID=3053516 RepID=UPI002575ACB0|nr:MULTISPECIES: DUF1854 domain-containing protein [unclassified Variovorax]MDM0017862.1 DUF1854 domain-containing protein [Variovorax sp. J22R187]MDM0024833.1 DUF1854 domain-containing protein [Variovorax sp. J31P216]
MEFEIERDAFGRLVLIDGEGLRHVGVLPVRAFPLSAPDDGLSLVGSDGRELLWVDRVDALPESWRALLAHELAARDFAPTLLKLHKVSSFGVPSTWSVATDRGETSFVLKAEEDIRRLEGGALLIASAHGVQFRIPDVKSLDRGSRKLLERFL